MSTAGFLKPLPADRVDQALLNRGLPSDDSQGNHRTWRELFDEFFGDSCAERAFSRTKWAQQHQASVSHLSQALVNGGGCIPNILGIDVETIERELLGGEGKEHGGVSDCSVGIAHPVE